MCLIASIFLLQRLKGSMSRDARDFNNIETRAVIKFFFFPQGKAPKEILAILTETLGDGQLSEFFFSGLQKVEQRAKKCIEFRGEYVE